MGTLCVGEWVGRWERGSKEDSEGEAQQNEKDISHYPVFFVDSITETHKLCDLVLTGQLLERILCKYRALTDCATGAPPGTYSGSIDSCFVDFPPFCYEHTAT